MGQGTINDQRENRPRGCLSRSECEPATLPDDAGQDEQAKLWCGLELLFNSGADANTLAHQNKILKIQKGDSCLARAFIITPFDGEESGLEREAIENIQWSGIQIFEPQSGQGKFFFL